MAKGKPLDEAKTITNQLVAEALGGLPKNKMPCSNLGAEALTLAIENYQDRRAGNLDASGSKPETVKKRNTCTRCDGDNPEDAKFCMACGERIEC